MDEIKVDYYELGKRIKDLAVIYTALVREVKKLGECAETLDIFWDGDAGNAYVLRINRDLEDFTDILGGVRKLIKCAKEALRIYLDNEKETERVKEEIVHGA